MDTLGCGNSDNKAKASDRSLLSSRVERYKDKLQKLKWYKYGNNTT